MSDEPYPILALDGGGVRGVYTAVLLERLEEKCPGFLAQTRLFAGTSTGGILALALARGTPPPALVDLYARNAKKIFDDSAWDDLHDLGKLIGADYDQKNLRKVLVREFGDRTLGDLDPARVLVSSFDLDNEAKDERARTWKPKFFHNFKGEDADDRALRMVDVALATSAAPTYFPTYRGYVDGGVVANNPSMAALAQALDGRTAPAERATLDRIVLLSLGTGTALQYIPGDEHDWGYSQWAPPLVRLMLEGSMGVADYQCFQLLGDRYARLAPCFPPGVNIELDDAGRVADLIQLAHEVDLGPTVAWLRRRWPTAQRPVASTTSSISS